MTSVSETLREELTRQMETFSEELKGDKFAWLLTKAAEKTEEPKEQEAGYLRVKRKKKKGRK